MNDGQILQFVQFFNLTRFEWSRYAQNEHAILHSDDEIETESGFDVSVAEEQASCKWLMLIRGKFDSINFTICQNPMNITS